MKYVKVVLASILITTGTIGMDLQAVNASSKTYDTKGSINFNASSEGELPVYPLNPNPEKPVIPVDPSKPNELKPGTGGPLSIDFVSNLAFGEQLISTKNETYYAKAQTYKGGEEPTANYVQITDKTGESKGWRLTVEQQTGFTAQSSNAINRVIQGAELSIQAADGVILSNSDAPAPVGKNIKLTGAGSSEVIVAANKGNGAGLWTITFGQLETKNGSVVNTGAQLKIPGAAQTDADLYKTQLVWKVEDVPGFQ